METIRILHPLLVMDQAKGVMKSSPHTDGLIHGINNASIAAEMKIEIMQWAVAKCPKMCITAHEIQIPSLLGFWQ